MKLFKQVFILFLSIFIISCSSENNDDKEDEIPQGEAEEQIMEFIGSECFTALKELDFNVRAGTNNPEIEGFFVIDPLMVRTTSNVDFEIGEEEEVLPFGINNVQADGSFDFTYLFFQNEKITNTLYMGNGNEFSLFFFFDIGEGDEAFRLTYGFSGIITDNGIEEGQFFLCQRAIDDINNGTNNMGSAGLLFFDGDGLIERF